MGWGQSWGMADGPGLEDRVLLAPAGAPPLHACWGRGRWWCWCLGAATWTLPAARPISVHVQEMNFFLLLFWASSRGGWACRRGGGPRPGSRAQCPLHSTAGAELGALIVTILHPPPPSRTLTAPPPPERVCSLLGAGFGDTAGQLLLQPPPHLERGPPDTPRLLQLPQRRLGTHPGPAS